MKITVTDTSQTLDELLSTNQKSQIARAADGQRNLSIMIYNADSAEIIYVELGWASDALTAMPVKPDKSISLIETSLRDIHLIGTAASIDCRVLIGQ